MKTSFSTFVHAKPATEWDAGDEVMAGHRMTTFPCDDMTSCGYVLVGPATVSFDLPEDWDPRRMQLKVLREREALIRQKFTEDISAVQNAISSLLAIEMSA